MDKELLQALNNLSESLEKLAETLGKKDEPKSATGAAVQMGSFEKQIKKIHNGVTSIKKDTSKLLNQQDTILKILQKKDGDKSNISSQQGSSKGVSKDSTNVSQAKQSKEEKEEAKIKSDKKKPEETKPSKIKEGLASILMIAAGIVAIGMAFKLVGTVNIVTVLALSAALPLIAIAFAKIANALRGSEIESEDLDKKGKVRGKSKTKLAAISLKDLAMVPVAMAAMAFGLMVSSPMLAAIKPVGFLQIISAIGMSFAFSMMIPAFAQMANNLKTYKSVSDSGVTMFKESIEIGTILKAVVLLPIVMVAISYGIMLSSRILKEVRPVGLLQLITTVFIAGAFGLMAYSMGTLIGSFKKINPMTAVKAAFLMPLVLVSLSVAIVLSSRFLRAVTPIGLLQALTAILIAGVFAVLSFGLEKIIKSFKRVNPVDATKAALLLPFVMVSMSVAIMLASPFLKNVTPIGFAQALSSIAIAAVFAIVSFGLGKIINALKRFSMQDTMKVAKFIPIIFTSVAIAMMISSFFFSMIKPMSFAQFLTVIGMTVIFVAVAIAFVALNKILKGISKEELMTTGQTIVGICLVIALSSLALSIGNYKVYPSFTWTGHVVLAMASFGLAGHILGKFAKNKDFYLGLLAIVVISVAISISSQILSLGKYTKYPSVSWSLGVGLSLAFFGIGAVLLGTQTLNPFFYAGLGIILVVAGTIVATSYILSVGKYNSYPPLKWVLPVVLILGTLGLVASTLGLISPLIMLGTVSILLIAGIIYGVDKLFTKGKFNRYPSFAWVKSVLALFGTFGLITAGMALLLPFIILGSVSLLMLAGTIVLLDKVFSKGSFTKFPSAMWVSSVSSMISSINGLLKIIKKDLGFFDFFLGSYKLTGMADMVLKIDRILSKGVYKNFPSSRWSEGVGTSLRYFLKLLDEPSFFIIIKERVASLFGGGMDDLANMIVKIDLTLSRGSFKKFPEKKWNEGITAAIKSMIKLQSSVGVLSSIKNLFKTSVSTFADLIVQVDRKLSTGQFKKFPSSTWTKGTYDSIMKFVTLRNNISKATSFFSSQKSLNDGVINMADMIAKASLKLSTGNYTKYPSLQWAEGTLKAMTAFNKILEVLGGKKTPFLSRIFGRDPLSMAQSNIEKLAKSFSKLSVALKGFTNSIKGVDVAKLNAIKSLTSHMVLMSIMDPKQFDQMMDKLEERTGLFAALLSEIELPGGLGKQKEGEKGTGGGGGTQMVKQPQKPGQGGPKQKSEIAQLMQKVDVTNALLKDISSVVGSSGTLKTYLASLKSEVTIGGSGHVHTKSDLRLKNIIKKIGISNLGINIYLFTYKFDPKTVYQGIIAQELLGTPFESALHIDTNGIFSVDYSKIDIEFKKHLDTSII
jgi:hypothetical protein